jgi:PLP dependent protein
MSEFSVAALHDITARIAAVSGGRQVTLVAVSKTFGVDDILPLLQAGHRVFGENRVQEAETKWPQLKLQFPDIELHLIGPLQSNKTAQAVALFDVVQTIDRPKIAAEIAKEVKRQGRDIKVFVQVNIGDEAQKAGVAFDHAEALVDNCKGHGLAVQGLMCIPPVDSDPKPYFRKLAALNAQFGLQELSMGMSSDFEAAVVEGATLVRVGSAIFGARGPVPG